MKYGGNNFNALPANHLTKFGAFIG